MKFKAIFILFNAVVLISFSFVGVLPAFLIGPDYALLFWGNNWYLAALFALVLALLNGYFIVNWSLFTKLEAQDWEGLIGLLEQRIYRQSRASAQNVRILINTYVVRAMPERISELERHLRSRKERLVRKFALQFGVAHLLSGDGERIVGYFSEMREKLSGRSREWADWNHAFGLTLSVRIEESRSLLIDLATRARNDLVRALSLYLLSNFAGDEHIDSVIEDGVGGIRAKYTAQKWRKFVEANRGELQVLAVSRIIDEASGWLFDTRKETT